MFWFDRLWTSVSWMKDVLHSYGHFTFPSSVKYCILSISLSYFSWSEQVSECSPASSTAVALFTTQHRQVGSLKRLNLYLLLESFLFLWCFWQSCCEKRICEWTLQKYNSKWHSTLDVHKMKYKGKVQTWNKRCLIPKIPCWPLGISFFECRLLLDINSFNFECSIPEPCGRPAVQDFPYVSPANSQVHSHETHYFLMSLNNKE